MRTFIAFDEALSTVLDASAPLGAEHAPLSDTLGRTLAADIVASSDIPPFANSAMDGFAVRAADLVHESARLRIVGEAPAGRLFDGTVEPGQCVRIMTGAPVPDGADTVVPVESTEEAEGYVMFEKAPEPGAHIRGAGKDVRAGERVLESGTVISPPVVGMLATLGVVSVPVSRKPRVVVVSTGDEIVDASMTPGPGQIRNSNGPALAAQAVSAGAEVVRLLHVPDDPESTRNVVSDLSDADLVLFSGGVSMGTRDYVRTELERAGAHWSFWKVRQRPGKPLVFGTMQNTLLLGLPGNPVSSSVCFEVYARPLLARLQGRTNERRPLLPARLGRAMKKVHGLHYFARGIAAEGEAGLTVTDTGPQGSNLYSSMVYANALIHMPEEMENPAAGEQVLIERLLW